MLTLAKQELSSAVIFILGWMFSGKNESFQIFYQETKAFKQWGNTARNEGDQPRQ